MKRVILEQKLGFVATVCADGTPNLSPKGTTTVWDDEHLLFADIASPQSIANLALNPAIEINVVDPFVRKGYRFKGTGAVHTRGSAPFEEAVALMRTAGSQLVDRVRSIVVIEVREARLVTSPAYDDGTLNEAAVRKLHRARFDALHGCGH
jgi:uncharacterized protein